MSEQDRSHSEPPDEFLEIEDLAAVRVIAINRPRAANALTISMRAHLCEMLSEAERAQGITAIVLTGRGKVFSAGVDFREAAALDAVSPHDRQFKINPGKALRAMTTPVICAVNGACVSGGLEMALSCSFIVASDRAHFADTHAKLGVVPAWGLTALLPDAVGLAMARQMSITGLAIGAPDALRLRLVNEVVSHDALMERSLAIARSVSESSAATDVLGLYARGAGHSLQDRLALETEHVAHRVFDPQQFVRAGESSIAPASGEIAPGEG